MKTLVLVLGLLSAFGPLSIDMYLPALSAIAEEFGAPISQIQLSLSTYFVGLALGQVFYGPVTDRWGRKKPLYFGMVVYMLASFACAAAESASGLATARFFQALGSCAGMVISRAVVRDKFDARDSAKTFSLLMLIMGIAPILAPALGSQMLLLWSWRSIFYFLGGLAAATILALYLFLPETQREEDRVPLNEFFSTFKGILKDRSYMGYTLSSALAYGGMFAYITGSAYVFLEHFGFTPIAYSALFGVNAAGIILFSQINGILLRTMQPQRILEFATPAVCVFGVGLLLTGIFYPQKELIIAMLFLYLATLGMMFPNASASSLAGQKRAGSASALMGTIQFTAAALISGSVSYFHNETVAPMTIIVGLSSLASFAVFKLVAPKFSAPAPRQLVSLHGEDLNQARTTEGPA